MRQRNRLYKRYKKQKTSALFDEFKQLRNKVTSNLRKDKQEYIRLDRKSIVKFSIYLNRRVFVTSNQKSRNVRKRTFRHVHSRSLIRIFTVRILDSQGCSIFMRTTKTLIRMHEYAGWFESSFCRPCQKVLFVTWLLRYGVACGVSWSINRHLTPIFIHWRYFLQCIR